MVVKAEEVRDLTDRELVQRLTELKTELFNLRFQKASGEIENVMRIREVRKDIARIKTIVRARELGIEQ